MGPRVRFAPSPSGYLHIGGARTAIFNWLWARSQGGVFVLRVEDTDQERSSLESVRAVLDALRWLGLDWDEGPEVGGPHAPYFQSERRALYGDAVEHLVRDGKAYRCFCTKEELASARDGLKARDPKAQFVYPGTCRDRRDEPDLPHVVRFRSPAEGRTDFDDLVFGAVSTPNSAQQDFVVVRNDGFPLYNLACVVDDHAMGIDLVARGRDHIGNTPQQVLLYQAFGWPTPRFAHLPLMLSGKGEKLSKRHGAVSVGEYRERGYPPDAVLNYLVRFGWSHGDQEIFSRDDLVRVFGWDSVGRADGKFDEKKFADVAFEHLKRDDLVSDAAYASGVAGFLAEAGLTGLDQDRLAAAIATVRPRARSYSDAALAMDFYFREPPAMEPAAAALLDAQACARLASLADALERVETWTADALEAAFGAWIADSGLTTKDVAQATRAALTGRKASPGLFEVMAALGRAWSLARLRRAP